MEKSLNENTYERLKNEIMTFQLVPGTVISAQKIADRYEVSRTPAREAIIKLENEGLILILPQSGSYVARIHMERAMQEWFVRHNLELGMASLFMQKVNVGTITKMEQIIEQMEHFDNQQNKVSRIELDNQFHDLIYETSGEMLARSIINTQMTHYNRMRFLAEMQQKNNLKTEQEHRQLLAAIKRNDVEQFQSVMEEHISRILTEKEELVSRYPDYFV